MNNRTIFAGLIFGILATASPALAEQNCGLRDKVVDRLQSKFSETLTAGGLQPASNIQTVIEVWASKETGTFTVIVTTAEGVSCILAAGTDFFTKSPEANLAGTES